ncbi:putative MFS family arabinose efflux permease [Chromobacterium alkanivorans]|uniref:MFS transporter n=1 Tax=Chromobacterium alkanivorans TaxID=1071719 RepID=UPI002167F234|nr:MFS transporter [Chromobacterium alkanivorans]MCS3802827.1 putative MFS family arabinose efflux permease [Chromobacterium alkanivorans]MCS3817153.1 putative MFS family arabinose efflux permease [Chromobacterium alkanivorans]MCS3872193.1 putative MFS family arabinose efflux permease [Chromobacterium alkanivorans]
MNARHAPSPLLKHKPANTPANLVWLFAVASGLSVANVYYAQPLLDALARDFAISQAAVGGVVTATQAGCALALLLLVPLGDLLERRRLMAAQLLALAAALTAVAMARTAPALLAGVLAVGLLGTAMTQGLIAYAASAAAPHEQGRVVGAAQSGVFIGLLLARVFAGAVSDLAGWRGVYLSAAALMLAIALPLWRRLPALAPAANAMRYPALLASMLTLLRREKALQVRGMLALLMFAAFNIFWSALALPLSAPPHNYSHTAIGALGLVGALGALAAARAGQWADRGQGQRTSAAALALLLLAWWPLSLMQQSLAALLVGILLLDLGGQALHVTNQSLIFRACPEAHGRLVGLYMLFYALGSGLGAIGATAAYAHAGWQAVCGLGAAVSLLALLFWWATLRLTPTVAVK